MDHFDYENILHHITRHRSGVIEQIEAAESNERKSDKKIDLLSLVLDYTPNTKEDTYKKSSLFYLNNKEVHIPEFVYKTTSGLSLNLETKQNDDDDNLSEKNSADDKVKTSIIALKLDKSTKHNHPNPIKEILYDFVPADDKKSQEDNLGFDERKQEDFYENEEEGEVNDATNHNEEEDQMGELYISNVNQSQKQKRRKSSVKKQSFPLSKPSFSKLTNIVNERNKVRIYLLRTPGYIDLEITSSDSFNNLKHNLIKAILKENHLTLKYTTPEAYELRQVDDDDEIPNMDFPELPNEDNVIRSKHCVFAFIERENYVPLLGPSSISNINEVDNTNIDIRIHFKIDQSGSFSKEMSLKHETSLRKVLEFLSNKKLLNYKNIDLYYFTEHTDTELDMDNAINIDACLYYLFIKEFDLYFKKFSDVPASISYSQLSKKDRQDNEAYFKQERYPKVINQKSRFVVTSLEESSSEEVSGKECLFNDVTAGIYQEFEVLKIKKDKSRQERVLGIDMYNLYNSLPKTKAQHMLMTLISRGTKRPLRKIKDIVECGYLDNRCFYINIIHNDSIKQLAFEVKDIYIRNVIVSKIKHLTSINKDRLD